jgi:hypothetical protein
MSAPLDPPGPAAANSSNVVISWSRSQRRVAYRAPMELGPPPSSRGLSNG